LTYFELVPSTLANEISKVATESTQQNTNLLDASESCYQRLSLAPLRAMLLKPTISRTVDLLSKGSDTEAKTCTGEREWHLGHMLSQVLYTIDLISETFDNKQKNCVQQ
jgi:hypothetical protein